MDDPYAIHTACSEGDLLKVQELLKDPVKDLEQENYDDINPIGCAIKSGYLHIVQFLLEKVGNVNYSGSSSITPLHYACAYGMTNIVQWLLDNGANPNLKDSWWYTPMHKVFKVENQERRIDIIKRLLNHGADPWVTNLDNVSAISLAFQKGNLTLVQLFKDKKFDIDFYKTVETKEENLLFVTVKAGNMDLIPHLVATGVDFRDTKKIGFDFLALVLESNNVDLVKFAWKVVYKGSPPDSWKQTAIHIAAQKCEVSILKLLIELGCKYNVLNNYLETPLLTALVYGQEENAGFLLEKGLNVNEKRFDGKNALHLYCHKIRYAGPVLEKVIAGIRDINGTDHAQRTPLHYAAMEGYHEIIKTLIKHGADPKAVDNKRATALHYFCGSDFFEWDSESFDCLARGVGIEPLDEQQKTPLHYAADNSGFDHFEQLVERGANMEAISDDKGSVLHHALAAGSCSKVKFMLQKGVFNDTPNKEGKTPLLYSIRSTEMAKTLLDKGANIHAVDNEGQTALHLASKRHHFTEYFSEISSMEEVAAMLLERGSNVNAVDKRGRTPLHIAFDSSSEELIDLLLAHGADKKAVDNDGRNILHYVVPNFNDIDIVSKLFDVSLNVPDKNGHRPLFYANDDQIFDYMIEHTDNIRPDEFKDFAPRERLHLSVEYLKKIFERGASANTTDEHGNTLLHKFTTSWQEEKMEFLLERGADVNAKNKDLVTPLHLAAERSYESVKFLVEHGADVAALDKDGKAPRDYARESPIRCELIFAYL